MKIKHPLERLRRVTMRAWALVPVGAQCQCCLCGSRVRRFLPYRSAWGNLPAVLIDAGVIGSDVQNFECPACGCHDRERHLFLYLQASGMLQSMAGARVLHLAPELQLGRIIVQAAPLEYVAGDLHPAHPGIRKLDLMALDVPDDSQHVVIANHVLEHVDDEQTALREILRVLRPGGHAILQTPYASLRPHKFEDLAILTEAARLRAYGQQDHRRLFGADFPGQVVAMGFVDQTATHAALLAAVDSRRMGVNPLEPFLLFRKPEA